MTALAPTLQGFFTDRMTRQRNASPHTIAGYRDTWRMLLTFAATHTKTTPSLLGIDDIDAPLVGAFLDHLENDRGNSIRTRNTRLAAIHSLFRYAAVIDPEHAQSPGSWRFRPNASTEHYLLPHRTRGRRAARSL